MQSWHQRLRWSRGYLQVFGKYGGRLVRGMAHGSFACYDMSMAIMPAAVLSLVGLVANCVATTLSIVAGQGLDGVLLSLGSLLGELLPHRAGHRHRHHHHRVEAHLRPGLEKGAI